MAQFLPLPVLRVSAFRLLIYSMHIRHRLAVVCGTTLLFLLTLAANEWIFRHSEFVRGVNWIYLPAGIRLLCTLLFGGLGAIGILIASWISCFFYYFPNDPVRAAFGGIISALAPYLVYLFATRKLGLSTSLVNLTAGRLLVLALLYSLAGPGMQQTWSALSGDTVNIGQRFIVMFIGDLSGTLMIIYTLKLGLRFVTRLHTSMHRASPLR
jgi:hypothetical protein